MKNDESQGFDLGQYLEQARAEGQTEAVAGQFTIAKDKALDKLAHFSLPGPYDWVLKIVQAANAWDCECLHIGQTLVATSFYMLPATDKFPTDRELVEALQNGSLETAGAVHELCLALRSLVDQAQLSFVLALRYEGVLGEPISFGADVSQLNPRERRQWGELKVDGLRLTVSHLKEWESVRGRLVPTFTSLERRDIEIVKILEKRAYLSPCPIMVDGRDITNPYHHPSVGQDLIHRPLALGLLSQREKEGVTWDTIGVLSDVKSLRRPKHLSDRRLYWCMLRCFEWYCYCKPDAISTLLTVDVKTDSYHRFFWLRHGVIAHRRALSKRKEKTTLFLVIPGRDLKTDLTGLSLRFDDRAAARLEELQNQVRLSLDTIREDLENLSSGVKPGADLSIEERPTGSLAPMAGLKAGETSLTAGLFNRSRLVERLSKTYLEQRKRLSRSQLTKRWEQGVKADLDGIKDRLKGTALENS